MYIIGITWYLYPIVVPVSYIGRDSHYTFFVPQIAFGFEPVREDDAEGGGYETATTHHHSGTTPGHGAQRDIYGFYTRE